MEPLFWFSLGGATVGTLGFVERMWRLKRGLPVCRHDLAAIEAGCGCQGADGPCNACRLHGHDACGLHSKVATEKRGV